MTGGSGGNSSQHLAAASVLIHQSARTKSFTSPHTMSQTEYYVSMSIIIPLRYFQLHLPTKYKKDLEMMAIKSSSLTLGGIYQEGRGKSAHQLQLWNYIAQGPNGRGVRLQTWVHCQIVQMSLAVGIDSAPDYPRLLFDDTEGAKGSTQDVARNSLPPLCPNHAAPDAVDLIESY